MSKHVRVDGERQFRGLAEPSNEVMKAHWADWPATFGNEDVGFRRALSPYFAQRAHLIASNRVNARRAALGSADMQAALVELNLMLLEATDFTRSQPMTIGDQDHGGIAMTTAIHLAGRVHQSLDLALGEVATCNCEVFSGWRVGTDYLFSHVKSPSCRDDWEDNSQSAIFHLEKKQEIFCDFLSKDFWFFETGSGTRSRPPAGRRGGWESESLRVFNTRQESGNGTRELDWVQICASIWDPDPRLGPGLPGDRGR